MNIKRYFGTSSGAIAAVGLVCNFDIEKWKESYFKIYEETSKGGYMMECYKKILLDFYLKMHMKYVQIKYLFILKK